MADLAALTPGGFQEGDRCTLGDGTAVEISEVTALPSSPGAPREPFRVVFSGAGPGAVQGTYIVRHPRLGPLELFLVPTGPGRLEATFG